MVSFIIYCCFDIIRCYDDRLSAHVVTLESGKRRKEAEVAEFLVENDNLREQLDLKETELSAMRQQLRAMFKERMNQP